MDPLIIILGIVAFIAAVAFVIAAFADENIVWLGVAAICLVGAYFGIYNGAHHEFLKLHAKHVAILDDLRSQGFNLASSDVYANGGSYYTGTEADMRVGSCLIPFIARYGGRAWRIGLPSRIDQGSIVVVTPEQVQSFRAACE